MGARVDVGGTVPQQLRGAGNALPLEPMGIETRHIDVVIARRLAGVVALECAALTAAEAEAVQGRGRSVHGERAAHIERQDAADERAVRRSLPSKRCDGAAQRGGGKLRNADDLKPALPLSRGRIGVEIRVGQTASSHGAFHGQRPTGGTDAIGCKDVFVNARIAGARRAETAAAAVPVAARIGGIDRPVLHLNDEQHVARHDRHGGAGTRAERDRRRPSGRGIGPLPVGIDDTRECSSRAISTRVPAGGRRLEAEVLRKLYIRLAIRAGCRAVVVRSDGSSRGHRPAGCIRHPPLHDDAITGGEGRGHIARHGQRPLADGRAQLRRIRLAGECSLLTGRIALHRRADAGVGKARRFHRPGVERNRPRDRRRGGERRRNPLQRRSARGAGPLQRRRTGRRIGH